MAILLRDLDAVLLDAAGEGPVADGLAGGGRLVVRAVGGRAAVGFAALGLAVLLGAALLQLAPEEEQLVAQGIERRGLPAETLDGYKGQQNPKQETPRGPLATKKSRELTGGEEGRGKLTRTRRGLPAAGPRCC